MHEENSLGSQCMSIVAWVLLPSLVFPRVSFKARIATGPVYDLKTYLQVQTTSGANYILDTLQYLDAKTSIFFEMNV